MNASEYVAYCARRREDSARRRSSRLAVAVLLILIALAAAFGPGAARADEERFEPSSRSGRDAVRELAERHFPADLVPWAMRTAGCESSFDLYARSSGFDRRYGWYEHIGAWQVSVPTWAAKAWELFGGSLYEPEVSAAMAAWIVTSIGPQAWPVCGR